MENIPNNFNYHHQDLFVVHSQKKSYSDGYSATLEDTDTPSGKQKVFSLRNTSYSKISNLFKKWKKLIACPENDPHDGESTIYDIVQQEGNISLYQLINNVLAEKLNIAHDSPELEAAIHDSNKIFHEDFPGDFILEYEDDRLGMFLLESQKKLDQVESDEEVTYTFRPDYKSFKWR
ncbi:hypothetical protein [Autumnicola musiva]|uniref:Uncharacterized protein n=1 Tax=Autumnicola musiva TaxID=3075589 RepID=A0ABU3D2U0_9FLAO|nr:hypothetical protein [Zunongwangia sp. F117]MDT0675851.1 hypothetical protein [Zunongwangia sp. F117]